MMMKKTGQLLIGSIMLIAITSCGTKQQAPTVSTSESSIPSPKVKTPPPLTTSELSSVAPQSQTHKIGILLPLTGPQADLGKGLLNAAEMALFESSSSSIILLPQDTAPGAHQAALKALNEGAELILGPVFASEVESVQPLLNARHINLISFSTDKNVAKKGSFILGLLPSQQIDRIVTFAKEKGLTKIAALTPDDQYGRLVDQTLKDLELKGDIQLLGITHYGRGDILEGNPVNTRIIEDVENYKGKGLQALLIPEGGENLTHLMNLLSSQGPLKILGSGQWDSLQTLKVAHHLKEGYFVSTDPQERKAFELRYQQAYGNTPPRIATLAYDATALAVALSNQGYTPEKLTLSQGFTGVEGLFRLTPQGLNERGFAILGVTPTGFKTLSAAPHAF
jgi:branched-chain amino acid transport system substrate-binding protein